MELKSKEEIQGMNINAKKLYLEELKQYKAQLEASKGLREQGAGLKRASETMMKYNPTGAFDLMDKAAQTEIDRQKVEQAGMKDKYDPDTVRFKLASRLNAITGLMAKMDANEPEYAGLVSESAKIKKELEKDNPSIQSVYASGEIEPPPNTTGATYESIQTLINGATKNTFEKVKSQVATDKGAAKLSAEQEKYIDELLEQKKKQLFPAGVVRPKTTTSDWLNPIKSAIGDLAMGSNVSRLNPSKAADKQIIWKVNQRSFTPESVNEGDLNLGSDWFDKAVSKVVGTSRTISDSEAIDALNNLQNKYNTALNTLKSYSDTKYTKYISEGTNKWITDAINQLKWYNNRNTEGGLKLQQKTTKLPEGVTYEVIKNEDKN